VTGFLDFVTEGAYINTLVPFQLIHFTEFTPTVMPSTSDFRPGLVIKYNNELWTVTEFQHVNPGNWRAFVRTKLKNVKSGKVVENRFRAGEAIEIIKIERKEFQFLYRDGSGCVFMDKDTYEQLSVQEEQIGDGAKFLKDGESVDILFNATEITGIELPITVELKVVETVPGVRGDSANAGTKPARVETGASVNVPLFINEGDVVKVDTRSGDYIERVKA
jgi:elongation factor P